jgi:hypothetical protein
MSWKADEGIDGLGKTKRIRDMVDPLSEEFDPTEITPTEGIPEGVPMASGAEGAPITSTVPDAKPKFTVGKVFDAGQTAFQLKNIGDVMADADATDEEKGVAGVQGTKILADLAGKRQVEKTGKKIFETAGGRVASGLGGALGAYTMVKEAGEAGEAWQEEDYDEAILHGMGSASGALQAAGGGMMASGVGAPLGAVLYGIGTAGSLISGAGLFLEGLFGGKEEVEEAKPKFDAGRYFDTIRSGRRD